MGERIANTWESRQFGTCSVDATDTGASPFGVRDFIGNVYEWCIQADVRPVTKGGNWVTEWYLARCGWREDVDADHSDSALGFQCARDVAPGRPLSQEERRAHIEAITREHFGSYDFYRLGWQLVLASSREAAFPQGA